MQSIKQEFVLQSNLQVTWCTEPEFYKNDFKTGNLQDSWEAEASWFCYTYFSLNIYVELVVWYTKRNNGISLQIIPTESLHFFSEVMFPENKRSVKCA